MINNIKGQSGFGFIWIIGLVFLFIVFLIYTSLSPAFATIFDYVHADASVGADADSSLAKIKNMWFVWPIVFVVSIIFWMFIKSIQGKEVTDY